jgi:hypothetical protein
MKNEDFDEAIREKLESLNQPYTEGDIDKVYNHVVSKRKFLWKGKGGSLLLYSLSAAAFTVFTYFAVSHFRNIDQVTVHKNNITNQDIRSASDSNTFNNAPSDTAIFIHSKTVSESQQSENQPVTKPDSVSNTKAEVPKQKVFRVKPQIAEKAKPNSNEVVSPIAIVSSQDKIPTQPSVDEPQKAKGAGNENVKINIEEIAEKIAQEKSAIQDLSQPVEQKAKSESKPANTPDKPAINQDTLIKTDSSKHGNLPDTTGIVPIANYKKTKIRIRTDFQLSNQSFGTGVSGELLFNNHFSVETGLKYRLYRPEYFIDKADLFRHKRPDFNRRIEGHLNGKDHISEISINNSLLQIPVTLKYYVPLKRNYSIYVSLGTDLDIYTKQKLRYVESADTGMMPPRDNNFRAKGQVSVLNNMVISAGLEKQWKSWSFQLQPFISPKLKEVFYKPKELEFGVNIGVKYCFGK